MADVGNPAVGVRIPPSAAAWSAGVAVAGVALAMLLHPTFGLYLNEGVALIAALGAAGLTTYSMTTPSDIDVRRGVRRPVLALAVTAYVTVLLAVPFDVMVVAGNGLRGLGDGLSRSVVLHSGEFETAVMRSVGLVLLVVSFRWNTRKTNWLGVAGVLFIIGSFALIGHARTGSPHAAATAAVLVHVGAASTWFGGLLGLGISLRHARADVTVCGRLLARFARTMEAVLALVLTAGVGLTILYLPDVDALVHTAYGQVLLIKLGVLSAVLIISASNHTRLVDMARRGNERAVRVLQTNIAMEQIGLLAILAITAVLMRQDPRG